jgi:hypothetical protein
MWKGIKKIFRNFEICAKVLSLLFENRGYFAYFNSKIRPKTTDTRLKAEEVLKSPDRKSGEPHSPADKQVGSHRGQAKGNLQSTRTKVSKVKMVKMWLIRSTSSRQVFCGF